MTHKVESQIHYKMDAFPECDVEIRPNVTNPSQCILNTVALLNEIYTGTTTTKKLEANNIRKAILREIKYFQELLINYYNDENTQEEKQDIEYKIERSLRKSTPYTVFKWWIIWDHPKLKRNIWTVHFSLDVSYRIATIYVPLVYHRHFSDYIPQRKILDIRLNIKDFRLVGVTGFEPATTRPPDVYSKNAITNKLSINYSDKNRYG